MQSNVSPLISEAVSVLSMGGAKRSFAENPVLMRLFASRSVFNPGVRNRLCKNKNRIKSPWRGPFY
jgi:hypothetical protein